jgi:heterodisulfide reductase subunit A-like polyferredoxin
MLPRSIFRQLASSGRPFSTSVYRQTDFTHAIIGGGAVGLAIARQLQARDGVSSVLIEKHGSVGQETSSRNSEVRARSRPALESQLTM